MLAPLKRSYSHSVLFHPQLKVKGLFQPYPDHYCDVWDSNHVKLPCSSRSTYPVEVASGQEKRLVSTWTLISQSFSNQVRNSYDMEKMIMAYNSRYLKSWNFNGLHAYFKQHSSKEAHFFGKVLPQLMELALKLPSLLTHAIPLLKKQQDYSVSFSQHQVACLLANAFLCTFPRRNSTSISSEYSSYPSVNFSSLFSSDAPGLSY